MAWKLEDDRPIWLQLVEQLRLGIVTGAYQAGERLPSVRELAAEAAVNPNTMQRALSELEREGLLINERTNGRRITENASMIEAMREALALSKLCRLKQELKQLGMAGDEPIDFIRSHWDSCDIN